MTHLRLIRRVGVILAFSWPLVFISQVALARHNFFDARELFVRYQRTLPYHYYPHRTLTPAMLAAAQFSDSAVAWDVSELLFSGELSAQGMSTSASSRWDGTAWQPDSHVVYTYGAGTKLTREEKRIGALNQASWFTILRFNYAGNRLSNWLLDYWADDYLAEVARYTAAYGYGDARITEIAYDMPAAIGWQYWRRYTIGYDTYLLTSFTVAKRVNDIWVGGVKFVLSYDDAARLTEILQQSWSGAAWEGRTRVTVLRNASNQVVSSTREVVAPGGGATLVGFHEFRYNVDGNRILSANWVMDTTTSDWFVADMDTSKYLGTQRIEDVYVNTDTPADTLWRKLYAYDASGRLTEVSEQHWGSAPTGTSGAEMDGVTETWIDTRLTKYAYPTADIGVVGNTTDAPEDYFVASNYPNPFNSSTTIEYVLERDTPVRITILNILGQTVTTLADGTESEGRHRVTWDSRAASSGLYFYRIETDRHHTSGKMLLIK